MQDLNGFGQRILQPTNQPSKPSLPSEEIINKQTILSQNTTRTSHKCNNTLGSTPSKAVVMQSVLSSLISTNFTSQINQESQSQSEVLLDVANSHNLTTDDAGARTYQINLQDKPNTSNSATVSDGKSRMSILCERIALEATNNTEKMFPLNSAIEQSLKAYAGMPDRFSPQASASNRQHNASATISLKKEGATPLQLTHQFSWDKLIESNTDELDIFLSVNGEHDKSATTSPQKKHLNQTWQAATHVNSDIFTDVGVATTDYTASLGLDTNNVVTDCSAVERHAFDDEMFNSMTIERSKEIFSVGYEYGWDCLPNDACQLVETKQFMRRSYENSILCNQFENRTNLSFFNNTSFDIDDFEDEFSQDECESNAVEADDCSSVYSNEDDVYQDEDLPLEFLDFPFIESSDEMDESLIEEDFYESVYPSNRYENLDISEGWNDVICADDNNEQVFDRHLNTTTTLEDFGNINQSIDNNGIQSDEKKLSKKLQNRKFCNDYELLRKNTFNKKTLLPISYLDDGNPSPIYDMKWVYVPVEAIVNKVEKPTSSIYPNDETIEANDAPEEKDLMITQDKITEIMERCNLKTSEEVVDKIAELHQLVTEALEQKKLLNEHNRRNPLPSPKKPPVSTRTMPKLPSKYVGKRRYTRKTNITPSADKSYVIKKHPQQKIYGERITKDDRSYMKYRRVTKITCRNYIKRWMANPFESLWYKRSKFTPRTVPRVLKTNRGSTLRLAKRPAQRSTHKEIPIPKAPSITPVKAWTFALPPGYFDFVEKYVKSVKDAHVRLRQRMEDFKWTEYTRLALSKFAAPWKNFKTERVLAITAEDFALRRNLIQEYNELLRIRQLAQHITTYFVKLRVLRNEKIRKASRRQNHSKWNNKLPATLKKYKKTYWRRFLFRRSWRPDIIKVFKEYVVTIAPDKAAAVNIDEEQINLHVNKNRNDLNSEVESVKSLASKGAKNARKISSTKKKGAKKCQNTESPVQPISPTTDKGFPVSVEAATKRPGSSQKSQLSANKRKKSAIASTPSHSNVNLQNIDKSLLHKFNHLSVALGIPFNRVDKRYPARNRTLKKLIYPSEEDIQTPQILTSTTHVSGKRNATSLNVTNTSVGSNTVNTPGKQPALIDGNNSNGSSNKTLKDESLTLSTLQFSAGNSVVKSIPDGEENVAVPPTTETLNKPTSAKVISVKAERNEISRTPKTLYPCLKSVVAVKPRTPPQLMNIQKTVAAKSTVNVTAKNLTNQPAKKILPKPAPAVVQKPVSSMEVTKKTSNPAAAQMKTNKPTSAIDNKSKVANRLKSATKASLTQSLNQITDKYLKEKPKVISADQDNLATQSCKNNESTSTNETPVCPVQPTKAVPLVKKTSSVTSVPNDEYTSGVMNSTTNVMPIISTVETLHFDDTIIGAQSGRVFSLTYPILASNLTPNHSPLNTIAVDQTSNATTAAHNKLQTTSNSLRFEVTGNPTKIVIPPESKAHSANYMLELYDELLATFTKDGFQKDPEIVAKHLDSVMITFGDEVTAFHYRQLKHSITTDWLKIKYPLDFCVTQEEIIAGIVLSVDETQNAVNYLCAQNGSDALRAMAKCHEIRNKVKTDWKRVTFPLAQYFGHKLSTPSPEPESALRQSSKITSTKIDQNITETKSQKPMTHKRNLRVIVPTPAKRQKVGPTDL